MLSWIPTYHHQYPYLIRINALLLVINYPPSLTKRARRDLNPRPTEPESVALSTEPRALILARV